MSTSSLARRLQAAISKYKTALAKSTQTSTPIMLYDPDGVREPTMPNLPDDFAGTVIYLPYVEDEPDFVERA